jgi:amino acid adenylation domain-containing protein
MPALIDLDGLAEPAAGRRFIDRVATGPIVPEAAALLLHGDFEAQAARFPGRLAVEWSGGRLTYGELDGAANGLAATLHATGLALEEPVAVFAERSAAHLVAVLAVLKAGGACLSLDAGHPDAHLRRIVVGAGTSRCLASPTLAPRAAGLGCPVLVLTDERLAAQATAPPPVDLAPDRLAYLVATSGTTGAPKIVEVEHRALANALRHSRDRIYAPGDLDLVPWTDQLAGDASIHQIFAPLGSGGTLVPLGSLEQIGSSPRFEAFTAFGATPSMLAALLGGDGLPPRLRAVMFGGEACPPALVDRIAALGVRRAVNVYGPTEAAIYCTANDVMAGDGDAGRIIGRPIANMRVELFDGQEPVPPGEIGEICIAGVGLARGYRGVADAGAFVELTGAGGARRRYYRSGDLGVLLPDGRLEFRGRSDRQAKIRGVRVELDAVERELGTLPDVERALVALRTDQRGQPRLLAWVVPKAGTVADGPSVRALALRRLPAAMVPQAVMAIDRVPLTAAGKPDLAALPEPPETAEIVPGGLTPAEALVAAEWRRVLGHDRFGRDDDFFDAGGDSLAGMEVLLRVGGLLGRRMAATDLGEAWTVASMARAAEGAPDAGAFEVLGAGLPGPPVFWLLPSFLDFGLLDGVVPLRPVYVATTDPMEIRRETFVEFAREMAERVRAVQPEGPYVLGGFCLGAGAAYELAVRLEAAGERVERLGLVDRSAPPRQGAGAMLRGWAAVTALSRSADAVMSPGWAWRQVQDRRFVPSAPLAASVAVMLTRHTGWRVAGLAPTCGWRGWIRGDLRVERCRFSAPADATPRMLRLLGAAR